MPGFGHKPLPVPKQVKVSLEGERIKAQGPKGELFVNVDGALSIKIDENIVSLARIDDSQRSKAMQGLTRKLIENAVTGVSKGFTKVLQINGVGYRADSVKGILQLSLGFSHLVYVDPIGANILKADGQTGVIVSGPDKQTVGDQAARIRKIRKPNPYSGKGIRYFNEVVKRKAGKAAAAKVAI